MSERGGARGRWPGWRAPSPWQPTVGACGDDDNGGAGTGSRADRAFLEAMAPHHDSAISMARGAKRRAEHPQITEISAGIAITQGRELRRLGRIHRRLFDEPLLPNEDAHEGLGLSAAEAGMAHLDSAAELEHATPFDKAFIDGMVPHHQGAIRMARAVQDETEDGEIRSLAGAIIKTQSNELGLMNDWRDAWYGSRPRPVAHLRRWARGTSRWAGTEGH